VPLRIFEPSITDGRLVTGGAMAYWSAPCIQDGKSPTCVVCPRPQTPCPRCQAYARLPKWRWLQSFITFVMGVPHIGQTPLLVKTPLVCFFGIYLSLWLSTVLAAGLVLALSQVNGIAAALLTCPLAISTLSTTGLFRAMHNYLLHHASHGDFGSRSRFIGELAGATAITISFQQYRFEHRLHHAGLTNEDDPDQRAITNLGFRPGLSIRGYRKLLYRLMFLRLDYFIIHSWRRLGNNLTGSTSYTHRLLFISIHGAVFGSALLAGALLRSPVPIVAWAVAWLLPITYGYFASMVLYSLGLHRWHSQTSERTRADYLAKTGARFFGDPCPDKGSSRIVSFVRWTRWWLRFLFVHLLVSRIAVIGYTDNGCHDVHHAYPRGDRFDWCNSTYARSAILESSADRESFWHTWGLFTAIRDNFAELEKTVPDLHRSGLETQEELSMP
jgi:fatty acid desaturase